MPDIRPLPDIPEVKLVIPARHADDRGFFVETWNEASLRDAGIDQHWVQDNHSLSRAVGTVRGLHLQVDPVAQAKLVRASRGAIFDVALDVRESSPTYGRFVSAILSADNGAQLYVPAGFAHGFMTLEPDTEVQYKVDAPYSAKHERVVRYNDPAIGIDWPDVGEVMIAARDRDAPLLAQLEL